MDKVTKNIPILFQKIENFENNDTRFTKVKIWLMHLGENLNGSFFSKESVEKAIPSLSNTPILAYLEENKIDELDASDHRQVLIREENGYSIKYLGQAYGCIPESCNPNFEIRLCDDGIEREFLTVEGLIWTDKFKDLDMILNRDGIKGQSMEIHDDYEGSYDKESNLYHFNDFKFYGACILGDFVNPAMRSSTVEVVNFSMDKFTKTIQEKMEEFKQFTINNEEVKGVITEMSNPNIEPEVIEPIKDFKEPEVIEEKDDEVNEKFVEPEEDVKDKDNEDPEEEMACKKKYTMNFELSHEGIRDQIYDKLWKAEMSDDECYYIVKTNSDHFIYSSWMSDIIFKQNYQIIDDKLELVGDRVEVKYAIIEADVYDQLLASNQAFTKEKKELEKDLTELKEFKVNKQKEEVKQSVDTIVSKFELTEEETKELKVKAYDSEISIDTLEEKLFALVGKKNFTQAKSVEKPVGVKFSITDDKKEIESFQYSSIEHLFN